MENVLFVVVELFTKVHILGVIFIDLGPTMQNAQNMPRAGGRAPRPTPSVPQGCLDLPLRSDV